MSGKCASTSAAQRGSCKCSAPTLAEYWRVSPTSAVVGSGRHVWSTRGAIVIWPGTHDDLADRSEINMANGPMSSRVRTPRSAA
jgi:hypothetical protein